MLDNVRDDFTTPRSNMCTTCTVLVVVVGVVVVVVVLVEGSMDVDEEDDIPMSNKSA